MRSQRMRSRRPIRRGLTLLEVLLASATLMMALSAIGRRVDTEPTGRSTRAGSDPGESARASPSWANSSRVPAARIGRRQIRRKRGQGWQWNADIRQQSTPNLYLVPPHHCEPAISREGAGIDHDVANDLRSGRVCYRGQGHPARPRQHRNGHRNWYRHGR